MLAKFGMGKRSRQMFPEQLFIDRADGIFSERNAMLYDSGRQKYELLLKRAGGWRTESYNEFYTKQNCEWVQVPSFHFDN